MKTLFATLVLLISIGNAQAQSSKKSASEGTTITITVPVPGYGGSLIAGLYNEENFMETPLQGLESDVNEGFASVTFTNVTPGTYAIAVYHDKNGNKVMDFEANGMPKELYGASNNNMSMGPPRWSDAKFEVGTQPITMEIRL